MGKSSQGWCLLVTLSAVLQHAAADPPAVTSRTIYRCETAAGVTFSDRPCDAAAEIYEASTHLNSYEAPALIPRSRTAPSAPARRRGSESEAKTRVRLLERCERIQQSLREIRSKMRAGYTAKEGERLRIRQAKLQEQRRAAKCR